MDDEARRAWILGLFARARLAFEQAESVSRNTGWSDPSADADAHAAVASFDVLGEGDLPILDAIAADPAEPFASTARSEARRIRERARSAPG